MTAKSRAKPEKPLKKHVSKNFREKLKQNAGSTVLSYDQDEKLIFGKARKESSRGYSL
jgi:hypothetical protein